MKEPRKDRIRIAASQYFLRSIDRFEQFADQVTSSVETAEGYRCRLLVFPEYFTLQLVALGDTKRPFRDQLRSVAAFLPQYIDLMTDLATRHGVYIVAGTIPVVNGDDVHNESFVFSPSGDYAVQGKLHMTRFEKEDWNVSASSKLKVIETDFGKMAVAICYDVEFPELVRAAAHKGAQILAVPSNTDDRHGFLRVRYCAHARTIENQMYVVHCTTVGGLPRVADVSLNYGRAAILTPSDYGFARDGILAESSLNQEAMIIGELDMNIIDQSRTFGTVLPLNDSHHTRDIVAEIDDVTL